LPPFPCGGRKRQGTFTVKDANIITLKSNSGEVDYWTKLEVKDGKIIHKVGFAQRIFARAN
jgi:hypothetical protein